MELVEGESLEELTAKRPLPLNKAVELGRQVAEGLQTAYEKGVVHRDIKPGNILVTPDGRVKILDFGLALLTEGSKLTQQGTTVGTVKYMSPEQAQGREVDHRTDIWALGCVLYEMISGRPPFNAAYDQAVFYSLINEEPEPLTGLRTGVPVELEILVNKCLAKERQDRYQTASELVVDLRAAGAKLSQGKTPASVPAATVSPRASFRPWPIALGLAALAVAIAFWASSREESPDTAKLGGSRGSRPHLSWSSPFRLLPRQA